MKKLLLLVLLMNAIAVAHAQKLDASKVPAVVKASFEKKYPGTPAKWEKEKDNYEVNFKQAGNEMSAVITAEGNIIETETDIQVSALPAVALSYIKEHYSGKKIKEASKIMAADGSTSFEAQVGDIDLLFDSQGNFLKQSEELHD